VRCVHRLEFHPVLGTQEIRISHEVLDGVENALEKEGVGEAGFKHCYGLVVPIC